jgi:hypothetical protein
MKKLLLILFCFFNKVYAQKDVAHGMYTVTVPSYFTAEIKSNLIMMKESSMEMVISAVQPLPSSGNLDTDINTYYEMFFKGWTTYSHYDGNEIAIYKGINASGIPYMISYRDIATGEGDNQIKRNACIIAFQLKNKEVGLLIGSNKHVWGASQYPLYEAVRSQYAYFIHHLHFNNYAQNTNVVALAGTKWSAVGSGYSHNFGLNGDGTFASGAATSFKVGYNATHDKVTNSSWGNDGTWQLNGNMLTRYFNSTKKTHIDLIRMVQEKKYDGTWEEKLGIMSKNGEVYSEAFYYKD